MGRKAKVLFMGALPPPYMGPTIATKVILNSELKRHFELIHLDTSDHRNLDTLNKIDGQNLALSLKHCFLLIKMIVQHWPTIIYLPICQTTLGYFRDAIFIVIAKIFRRKILCHLRGGNFRKWFLASGFMTRWAVRCVHSRVDGQIVLGESLKSLFKGILPQEKIFAVPNGININFRLENKKNLEKMRILYLSNFRKEKGILEVLESIRLVCQRGQKAEFVLAGNWFDRRTKVEIEHFLEENKNLPIQIKDGVFGKEKIELLNSSHIFVFPPASAEGHPWVIVEAMAAALPIITTNQGAIAECVRDGVNGFIVESKNPRQIAEKIMFLIDHPDILSKMGQESRRLYLENFTEEKMVERLTRAFHSVLLAK